MSVGALALVTLLGLSGLCRAQKDAPASVGVYAVHWAGAGAAPTLLVNLRANGNAQKAEGYFGMSTPTWTCPSGTATAISDFTDSAGVEYVDVDGAGQYATLNAQGEIGTLKPVEMHYHAVKSATGKWLVSAEVSAKGLDVAAVGQSQAVVSAAPTLPVLRGSIQITH